MHSIVLIASINSINDFNSVECKLSAAAGLTSSADGICHVYHGNSAPAVVAGLSLAALWHNAGIGIAESVSKGDLEAFGSVTLSLEYNYIVAPAAKVVGIG